MKNLFVLALPNHYKTMNDGHVDHIGKRFVVCTSRIGSTAGIILLLMNLFSEYIFDFMSRFPDKHAFESTTKTYQYMDVTGHFLLNRMISTSQMG